MFSATLAAPYHDAHAGEEQDEQKGCADRPSTQTGPCFKNREFAGRGSRLRHQTHPYPSPIVRLLNNMAPPPIPATASPLSGIVTEPLPPWDFFRSSDAIAASLIGNHLIESSLRAARDGRRCSDFSPEQ